MDQAEELLPGIEHFLTRVLAAEKLSSAAEERRLYFVERLDILKLPASCPPRPEARRSTPEPLEEEDGEGDFAAYQRELSRLTHSSSRQLQDDSDEEKNTVKVYDDIDQGLDDRSTANGGEEEDAELNLYEIPVCQLQLQPQPQLPVPNNPHSEESASPMGGGDAASLATVASIEDLPKDSPDSPPPRPPSLPPPIPTSMPPPLPPRRDRASDRNSGGAPGPPDLPARPGSLGRRSDHYGSEKSDRSEDHAYDLSDGEDTNYEHCSGDDDDHYNDVKLPKKPDVKLPKREKKKKERRLTQKIKSKVTSMWESGTPYSVLDDVTLSGELYLRSKLAWTRKVAALSHGNLCCYKPEKLQRPAMVVPLEGHTATWSEKDNKRGYEIRLEHPDTEDYVFSVDFKEWAIAWCEYMNAMAKGQSPPGPHQHLARTFPGNKGSREELNSSKSSLVSATDDYEPCEVVAMEPVQELPRPSMPRLSGAKSCTTLAKWDWKTLFYSFAFPLEQILLSFTRGDVNSSNSNLSLNSDGAGDDFRKPRLRGNKVMRMGSFAYRATQFFENMARKSSGSSSGKRRLTQSLSSPCDSNGGIAEENSIGSTGNITLTPTSDVSSAPVFEDSPQPSPVDGVPPPLPPPSDIRIEGDLNIFSSFNKRRWGTRWCLVRGEVFECYKNKDSSKCELNFDLSPCKLRRAVKETKSELALMILENNREKITIEPLNEESLCAWVRVLMSVTQTQELPAGLEVFMATVSEDEDEAERPEDLPYSTVNKRGPNSLNICDKSPDSGVNSVASPLNAESNLLPPADGKPVQDDPPVGDLYSEVLKKKPAKPPKPLQFQQVTPPLPGSCEAVTSSSKSGSNGEQKNTTDSGFYSVRDNNSDSDSGCEDNEGKDVSNGLSAVQEISDSCEEVESMQNGDSHSGNTQDSRAETEKNTQSTSRSPLEETQVSSRATENATIPEGSSKAMQDVAEGCDACCDGSHTNNLQESQGHQCNSRPQQDCPHPPEKVEEEENEYDVVETASDALSPPVSMANSVPTSPSKTGVTSDPSRSRLLSGCKDTALLTSQERLAAISKFEDMCDESKSSSDSGTADLLQSWGLDGFLNRLSLHQQYLPHCHGDGGVRTRARRGRGRLVSDPAGERVGQEEGTHVSTHAHSWFAQSSHIPGLPTESHDPDPFQSRSSLTVTGVEREGLDSVEELSPHTVDVTEKCSAGTKVLSIQDRINRLREKLVDIKRKRIAVRDKRQRASSSGEAERCDAEYQTLEEQCQTMEADIACLELQLHGSHDVTSSPALLPSQEDK